METLTLHSRLQVAICAHEREDDEYPLIILSDTPGRPRRLSFAEAPFLHLALSSPKRFRPALWLVDSRASEECVVPWDIETLLPYPRKSGRTDTRSLRR